VSTEGGSVPSGIGYGEGYPLLADQGSPGTAAGETDFWCI